MPPRLRGVVIRLLPNRGFGFVRDDADRRTYFIHAKNFREFGSFETLREGQTVEFTPTNTGPKGDGLRGLDIVVLPELTNV